MLLDSRSYHSVEGDKSSNLPRASLSDEKKNSRRELLAFSLTNEASQDERHTKNTSDLGFRSDSLNLCER